MSEKVCVKELSSGYGKKIVIKDIELEVCRGETVCILGPNGSGKSTFLKTLVALLKPLKGVVLVDGKNVFSMKPRQRAKKISVVLTTRVDPGMLRVEDVILLGRYPHKSFFERYSEEDYRVVDEVLKLVNAQDLRGRFFNELSDGERQKVLIARALAQEPEVLVLDEPTTFLDIKHRVEVLELLRRLARTKGITVIASLHDVSLALRMCDTIVFVKNGRIVAMGPPEEIAYSGVIEKLYDAENITFDPDTYDLELRVRNPNSTGDNHCPVFVVGGSGTAARVYRLLSRMSIPFATGILYSFDVDCKIAEAIGGYTICIRGYENVSQQLLELARKAIDYSCIVIDSGFPIGTLNSFNIELLRYAREQGKEIISLRSNPIIECKKAKDISTLRSMLSRVEDLMKNQL